MNIRNKVLSIARKEIGYNRWNDPLNGTKYGRWYGKITNSPYFGTNGVPYCAMFVSWVLDKAGVNLAGFPTASCCTAKNSAQRSNTLFFDPAQAQSGDLVLYDWDKDNSPDHIGIVVRASNTVIVSIEGNTSSGNSGSQSNGGGVYERSRSPRLVYGFIRLLPLTPDGDNIVVDGYWGKDTTLKAQKQAHTTADGIISCQSNYWKNRFKGCTSGWQWVSPNKAIGSIIICEIQRVMKNKGCYDGVIDGLVGIKFWQGMEKMAGFEPDHRGFESPSNTIKWFQKQLNNGTFF